MNFYVEIILLQFILLQKAYSNLIITELLVESGENVVNKTNPRLGWRLHCTDDNQDESQTAYQIIIASSQTLLESETPDLWDTGKVVSEEFRNIRYEGKSPKPGQMTHWAVRIWNQDNQMSVYKYDSWRQEFSIDQWTGKWISGPEQLKQDAFEGIEAEDEEVIKSHPGLKPVYYFRKTFSILEPVETAYIYCTAKGIYRGFLTDPDGFHDSFQKDAKERLLEPGWTDYNKTIQYATYDVTGTVNSYQNHVIGVIVAPGWYSGYIGPQNNYNTYGGQQSFLFELHIQYKNGSKSIITSDETWKVGTGPLVYSDLLHGEVFYENRQLNDWLSHDFNDSTWSKSTAESINKNIQLVAFKPSGIVVDQIVRCDDYWIGGENVWVYKFKRTVTGRISLSLNDFPIITRIKIRYGETVYPNGSIYSESHGSALDTDVFLLNDTDNRPDPLNITPSFTYHSFQFVEITGLSRRLDLDEIRAYHYSEENLVSNFYSDNQLLVKVSDAVQSSYRGNTLSVSTNTLSKDTRLGWLEPTGLFSLTGMYISGHSKLYKKWLRDIREAQAPSGTFSNVAPRAEDISDASPGSGTAPLIITYNIYKMFGDVDEVAENYESNRKWLKYVRGSNPNFLFTRYVNNEGDIGNVNADIPKDIAATAYYAYGALLMSHMAKALNKTVDHEFYTELHKNVSKAFVNAYVNEIDGKIKGDTQTGYVIALAFKMLPDELIPKAVENLVNNIKAHNLTTGYVGTAFILPVLSDYGHADIAYTLLLEQTYPSWGYMLDHVPSNIWERWDSSNITKYHDSSFNSLGLGSIGSWLYQYMAGVNTDDEEVGFKKIIIRPHIGPGVTYIRYIFPLQHGNGTVEWKLSGGTEFKITVLLPVSTNGKLILPFMKEKWERELGPGYHTFQVSLH